MCLRKLHSGQTITMLRRECSPPNARAIIWSVCLRNSCTSQYAQCVARLFNFVIAAAETLPSDCASILAFRTASNASFRSGFAALYRFVRSDSSIRRCAYCARARAALSAASSASSAALRFRKGRRYPAAQRRRIRSACASALTHAASNSRICCGLYATSSRPWASASRSRCCRV